MSSEKNRLEYIDLFRAFGIIVMILGHIKISSAFDQWIHAFHMPMFFFASGWFYRSNKEISVLTQILRSARSLLLPYVVFELIQWVILMVFIPEYRNAQTLLAIFTFNTDKIIVEGGNFEISPIPGALWFLTALFFIKVIYCILDRVIGYNVKLHICIVIIALIGMSIPTFFSFRLPLAIDVSFVGMGFFHIAVVVREQWKEKIARLKPIPALLIVIVISFIILMCPKVNMRTGSYGWFIPFWICAVCFIIACWSLSPYVEHFLDRYIPVISKWLKGIGKNSIIYLCLNQIVILAISELLYLIGLRDSIIKIPVVILTFAVLYGFEKLIINTRLKVIIGK